MKVEVIKIGKIKQSGIKDLGEKYLQRLKPFLTIEHSFLKDSFSEDRWVKTAGDGLFLVALDERGKQLSSPQLSLKMSQWQKDSRLKRLVFIVGGPYGFSEEFKKSAGFLWSLSQCTLPSDLSWVIVCEQLYRAMTIAKGMKYHHD